jgi:hypothetical protein
VHGDPDQAAGDGDALRPVAHRDPRGDAIGRASIRSTEPSPLMATHTARPSVVIATGPSPTAMESLTGSVRGSMRETESSSALATHTAPAPAAIATGLRPARSLLAERPVFWSMRRISSFDESTVQTDP